MPSRDHAALAGFELPRIDHGQRMCALIDDLPWLVAGGDAQIAGVSDRELDHSIPPTRDRRDVAGRSCRRDGRTEAPRPRAAM